MYAKVPGAEVSSSTIEPGRRKFMGTAVQELGTSVSQVSGSAQHGNVAGYGQATDSRMKLYLVKTMDDLANTKLIIPETG